MAIDSFYNESKAGLHVILDLLVEVRLPSWGIEDGMRHESYCSFSDR